MATMLGETRGGARCRAAVRSLATLFLIAAAHACTPGRAPDGASSPPAGLPATSGVSGAGTDGVPDSTRLASRASVGATPVEVRAVCDSVAVRWHAIPRATVQRADTVAEARETDYDRDPHRSYAACLVDAVRDEGIDSTTRHLRFWPARGWTPIWKLDADGPDGNDVTYQRGFVRCEVSERWDGGDDGDSTYVPSSYYGETTVCWRHRMPIGVLDTLHEEP